MTTSPAADVARQFYQAFSEHDSEGMARLYHPHGTFSDPVFGTLNAAEVGAMWRMLLGRASSIVVTSQLISATEDSAVTRWEADYPFSQTGRQVHNVVTATMQMQGGLILRHVDSFDFWAWSRQALGLPGTLLGWTPMLHRKVSNSALAGLQSSIAAQK